MTQIRTKIKLKMNTKDIAQAETAITSSMQSIKAVAKDALGLGGLLGLFTKVNSSMMRFASEMADVSTLTEVSLQKMADGILALDDVLGAPTDNARALYEAISSGVRGSAKELVEFTGGVSQLAKTTRATQEETVDAVTTIMNAYQLGTKDLKDISDSFFTTIKQGKIRGFEYAQSIGLVVNTAAEAGIELDTMNAAIASLSRTMPASNAIIALNQAINAFLKPTESAQEAAAEFGIELSYQALQSKGFAQAMAEIKDAVGDNKDALSQMFGNIRAARAAYSLTGKQAENFTKILGEFEDKAGSADTAFAKQTDNISAQWQKMNVATTKALISLGDALAPVVEIGTDVVSTFMKGVEALDGFGMAAIPLSVLIGKLINKFALGGAVIKNTAVAVRSSAVASTELLVVMKAMEKQMIQQTALLAAQATEWGVNTSAVIANTTARTANTAASRSAIGALGYGGSRAITGTTRAVDNMTGAVDKGSKSFWTMKTSASSLMSTITTWGMAASFVEIGFSAWKASGGLDRFAMSITGAGKAVKELSIESLLSSQRVIGSLTAQLVALGELDAGKAGDIINKVLRGDATLADKTLSQWTAITHEIERMSFVLGEIGSMDESALSKLEKDALTSKEALSKLREEFLKLDKTMRTQSETDYTEGTGTSVRKSRIEDFAKLASQAEFQDSREQLREALKKARALDIATIVDEDAAALVTALQKEKDTSLPYLARTPTFDNPLGTSSINALDEILQQAKEGQKGLLLDLQKQLVTSGLLEAIDPALAKKLDIAAIRAQAEREASIKKSEALKAVAKQKQAELQIIKGVSTKIAEDEFELNALRIKEYQGTEEEKLRATVTRASREATILAEAAKSLEGVDVSLVGDANKEKISKNLEAYAKEVEQLQKEAKDALEELALQGVTDVMNKLQYRMQDLQFRGGAGEFLEGKGDDGILIAQYNEQKKALLELEAVFAKMSMGSAKEETKAAIIDLRETLKDTFTQVRDDLEALVDQRESALQSILSIGKDS